MAIVTFWMTLGCMYLALQWQNYVVEGRTQSQHRCKQFHRYADCSHLQLSTIPQELPSDIEELILDFNHIESLDENSFLQYHDLKSINLQSNYLNIIKPYTFQNAVRLESISLHNNRIDTNYDVVAAALRCTSSIRKLDLSRNYLTEDMVTILLRNLTSLEFLSLDNNIIMRLDDSVFEGLSQLKELSLQKNYIYEIEGGTFDGLSKLSNLNLAYNNLPCIVDFGLTQLQVLNLSFNSIEWFQARELDEEFLLELLDISHNQLLFFPLLPRHSHLHVLLLADNELRFYASLPEAESSTVNFLVTENNSTNFTTVNLWEEVILSDLSNLHFLDMSRNQFHYLPEEFLAKMTSLSYLKLNFNCIETFSLSHKDITSALTDLDLSNNQLSNIKIDSISQSLLGLSYFNLSNNKLQTLPRHIFHNMNRINNLDLSYNRLHLCSHQDNVLEVNENKCVDIRNVPSLRYLRLSECGMELDKQRVFDGTAIISLELSHNQLKDIHSLLDIADTLQFLYLRNSLPFNVSVDFSAFKNLIGLDLSENSLTTFPTSLTGLGLFSLDLRRNRLTSLPLSSFNQPLLQSLNMVHLGHNPFDCCDLSWWNLLSKSSRIQIPDLQQVMCNFSNSYVSINELPESILHSCQWKTGGTLLYLLLILPMCLTVLVALLLLFLMFKHTLLQTLKKCCRRSSSY